MLFKFKKKKIVVDAFTTNHAAYELFPPAPAKRYIPDWFKKMDNIVHLEIDSENMPGLTSPAGTLKNCPGFLDLYKTGFMIPAWSDFLVYTNAKGGIHIETPQQSGLKEVFEQHTDWQFGKPKNTTFDNLIHAKLNCPWSFKEKSGVKFFFGSPSWNNYPSVIPNIIPGVIDWRYNIAANINMFFPKRDAKYDITAGHPLAHIIPLSEHDVEIKTHLCDKEGEWNALHDSFTMMDFAFHSATKRFKKEKEKIKKLDKESKCPFGFK